VQESSNPDKETPVRVMVPPPASWMSAPPAGADRVGPSTEVEPIFNCEVCDHVVPGGSTVTARMVGH
jgi:hypothetical protein